MAGNQHTAVVQDLNRETEAARSLLENMRDIIGEDEGDIATAVEGETNLHEAITRAVARVAELDALVAATDTVIENVKERQARLKKQRELIRSALTVAMEAGEIKKLELPLATLSLKRVAPSTVFSDEWLVPEKFWTPQPPKLDKKAVLDALKAGEQVPGATLSNGGQSIQVRFK